MIPFPRQSAFHIGPEVRRTSPDRRGEWAGIHFSSRLFKNSVRNLQPHSKTEDVNCDEFNNVSVINDSTFQSVYWLQSCLFFRIPENTCAFFCQCGAEIIYPWLDMRLAGGSGCSPVLYFWHFFVFVFASGMVALDQRGHVAAGTSTNGQTHKVPGCVLTVCRCQRKKNQNIFMSCVKLHTRGVSEFEGKFKNVFWKWCNRRKKKIVFDICWLFRLNMQRQFSNPGRVLVTQSRRWLSDCRSRSLRRQRGWWRGRNWRRRRHDALPAQVLHWSEAQLI